MMLTRTYGLHYLLITFVKFAKKRKRQLISRKKEVSKIVVDELLFDLTDDGSEVRYCCCESYVGISTKPTNTFRRLFQATFGSFHRNKYTYHVYQPEHFHELDSWLLSDALVLPWCY